ncbi:MAG: multidrug efflux RND transporter permease subunit [Pseudomonadota bacterium]
MSAHFFIRRPIFASVISIIIVLAGLLCLKILPIAQYPQIAPPTVLITATYPGASAETLSKTVAAPIEEQLNGIEGLAYFNSSATSDGTLTITATFDVGVNVDTATMNVNNRVQIAQPRLPEDVRRNGITVQKRSNDILLAAAISSQDGSIDRQYLSNYSSLNIIDELKRLPGVGDAGVIGAQDYAMRIWLKPDRMAQLGITTTDIANAIRAQNSQNAAGKIGQEPAPSTQMLVYTVTAKGRLNTPEQFANILIKGQGAQGFVRIKDVARVELGSYDYSANTILDGKTTVGIRVFLQVGANALDTANRVRAKLDELQVRFPKGIVYSIPFDTTRFVSESIKEVVHTLIEAAILVVIVVFIFLQSWRATLIPMIAVPISLIGTFAGLWLFNFGINTLTLFAMVLAIGIVVDDAIVVLENVERLMREEKLSPFDAAVKAISEVAGAVVAIVLVLCAVFIPVAFLGGIAGKLYQQFAVTVAISVVISGVVALTLTPALCALILQVHHEEAKGFFGHFNSFFERLTRFYLRIVRATIKHQWISALFFVVIIGIGFVLIKNIPSGFVPAEDQGYLIASVNLPDGATLQRTTNSTATFRQLILKDAAIDHMFALNGFDIIGGGNKSNSATIFLPLKMWAERHGSPPADQIAKQYMGMASKMSDGMALVLNPPPIRGLGTAGGFEVYVQNKADGDPKSLNEVLQNFITALKKRPELTGINTFFRPTSPQIFVEVDEAKAVGLGIPLSSIYESLQSTMGALYVNDFNKAGRVYRVQLQAEAPYRMQANDIKSIYVRGLQGMIPLSAISTIKPITGPEQLERYNGFLSAKIIGNSRPDISSGEAIKIVEDVAAANLPEGYAISWTGQAYQEKSAGTASQNAFIFALIMVFLILAAQYEKWSLPIAVLMAVPFAIVGALIAVWMRNMPNDIYFQIGLIVLIGLAAKNAILIIEFAAQKRAEGLSAAEAALEAARLRFRPIVMTSLAFVLGVVPLVFASGAGAAARRSMGTGVFGGMLVATFIATLFIPIFYIWLSQISGRKSKVEIAKV